MADNPGVTHQDSGRIEVTNLDHSGLIIRNCPGVHPDNVSRECPLGVTGGVR
jgi:glutathione-independent formaldehyde dehydrogenase